MQLGLHRFQPASSPPATAVLACGPIGEVSMEDTPDTLVAACQVTGLVAAALLLPSVLIDRAFDTDFLNVLVQAALAAFAVALIVSLRKFQKQK